MEMTTELSIVVKETFLEATLRRLEYITPELLLRSLCDKRVFIEAFEACGGDTDQLKKQLEKYLVKYGEKTEDDKPPQTSFMMSKVFMSAQQRAAALNRPGVGITHVVYAIFQQTESYALYYIKEQGIDDCGLLCELIDAVEIISELSDFDGMDDDADGRMSQDESKAIIKEFAPCLNDSVDGANPLIGREEEIERTIQILCRKEKNNVIHVGEPGVGKTAITIGLVNLINKEDVPEVLSGAKIFSLNLTSIISGAQFRGDFENRIKLVLDEIARFEKPIVYIDDIHNILNIGASTDGAVDAVNLLKPYMSEGKIRFIGTTTYEDYKKRIEKSKTLVRCFQQVEIKEPTEEECLKILEGVKKQYEKFHGVRYGRGVLEYAVSLAVKYINDKFLPDKALDIIDEAAAYRKLHPLETKSQPVDKELIGFIVEKLARVTVPAEVKDEGDMLLSLENRILSDIFRQDKAVKQVVNAVKFARAGLLEDNKPLASLLFVGPTGVGKTEIARVLARELSVKLIRFDMSEYGEKHSVAKLIGAPAGYVGYEEGGLLTDEIRKNPHCVLLLDEIEKAHPDIFHILLQVMDYATLSDNQGRKADFRNVIIIMTSNAGAAKLGKLGIGFSDADTGSDVILEEVKHLFAPEFRNRLNKIVVFNGIDDEMADKICVKKLNILKKLLLARKVDFDFSERARSLLKKKGTSREYGAREIDRVITNDIKPLLVDELLSGKLKKGGVCTLDVKDGSFVCIMKSGRRKAAEKPVLHEIKSDKGSTVKEMAKKTVKRAVKKINAIDK